MRPLNHGRQNRCYAIIKPREYIIPQQQAKKRKCYSSEYNEEEMKELYNDLKETAHREARMQTKERDE